MPPWPACAWHPSASLTPLPLGASSTDLPRSAVFAHCCIQNFARVMFSMQLHQHVNCCNPTAVCCLLQCLLGGLRWSGTWSALLPCVSAAQLGVWQQAVLSIKCRTCRVQHWLSNPLGTKYNFNGLLMQSSAHVAYLQPAAFCVDHVHVHNLTLPLREGCKLQGCDILQDTDDMDYLLPQSVTELGNCLMQLAATLIFVSIVQPIFLAGLLLPACFPAVSCCTCPAVVHLTRYLDAVCLPLQGCLSRTWSDTSRTWSDTGTVVLHHV